MSGRSLYVVRKDPFSIQHLVSSYQVNLVDAFVSPVKDKPNTQLFLRA